MYGNETRDFDCSRAESEIAYYYFSVRVDVLLALRSDLELSRILRT